MATIHAKRDARARTPKPQSNIISVPSVPPVTMRPSDAARYVGVSLSLMKIWIQRGDVRSVAVGGVRLVFVSSLHQLIGAP